MVQSADMELSQAKRLIYYKLSEFVMELPSDEDFTAEYDRDDVMDLREACDGISEELEDMAEAIC